MLNRLFVLLIAVSSIVIGQDKKVQVRISYFSSENVFVDGGKTAGLSVGNRLVVKKGDKNIAVLEVVFVAEHSASCKILKKLEAFAVGSVAETFVKVAKKEPENLVKKLPDSLVTRPDYKAPRRQRERRRKRTRISGSISAQYYGLKDNTTAGLDFGQPSLRANIRGRQLWGRDYAFRIRTRTRYNSRSRDYNSDVLKSEWRNRLYEMSFSYENREKPFNFRAGRIISSQISGIGYVDGLQLTANLTPGFQVGAFGGTQPDIRNSGFSGQVTKYGGFINMIRGSNSLRRFETTVSAAGEYNAGTVSREFLMLRNTIMLGNFRIYQSLEGDLNRQWRREKSGESFSVSNLYISGNYQMGKRGSIGVTFDNRKNYWTYEVRSVADSLFDDALRTGLRSNLSLRLPWQVRFTANGGFRKRDGEAQPTWSWFGSLGKTNFLNRGLGLYVSGSGFSNVSTNGLNSSLELSQGFRSASRFSLAYGLYRYRFDLQALTQDNHWVRSSLYLAGLRRLFLSGEFQYDWGGDIRGFRFFSEIGVRL